MSVEAHPRFEEWKSALEELISVKEAHRAGEATTRDVEVALKRYFSVADDI